MASDHIFSKKEISKILGKASEIQLQKDIYSGDDGLSEEELIHIAHEAGIDKESLLEALDSFDEPDLETSFNWFRGTSKVQHYVQVEGEISDKDWEDFAHEVRKASGGLGSMNKVGSSYEFEQVVHEIGHRHISFTSNNGKTKIDGVSAWPGFKLIVNLFSFMIPFMITAIFSLDANFNGFLILFLGLLAGTTGMSLGRIALKSYFENQKKNLLYIVRTASKKISRPSQPSIMIEQESERKINNSSSVTNNNQRGRA